MERDRPAAPWIAAVSMGYGHLRAAAALAEAAGGPVREADRGPLAGPVETRLWDGARGAYALLSRLAGRNGGGPFGRLLDGLTRIPPLRRGADLSAPDGAVRFLGSLARAGLGRGLLRGLEESGAPLVATFYAQAVAADAAGLPGVWCVVTDSDVHRVWVPRRPGHSGIRYCVPCARTGRRLRAYGVPEGSIHLTGFPLPPSRLGGPGLPVLRRELAARLARLDPRGVFRAARGREAEETLGPLPAGGAGRPPRLAFCTGGSGAQVDIVRRALPGLAPAVREGSLRLLLVAGERPRAAALYRGWLAENGLREGPGEGVTVLLGEDFPSYLRAFDAALGDVDVLWTKPSELTFFSALGLPLLLAPPLGFHERRNRRLVLHGGAALDQGPPEGVAALLRDRLADGSLATAAWRGFRLFPADGTYRILERVAGREPPGPALTNN